MKEQDIFADAEESIREMIDPEQIIDIDIEGIGEASKAAAVEMIEDISKFYYNDEFLKNHPAFKKRIDSELEALRIQLKMRRVDEEMQDVLGKSCCQNPQNASLFKSLTDMQRTIITIQGKIDDIVNRLSTMIKGYQLEINFDENTDDSQESPSDEPSHKSYRGTRDFIEEMANMDDSDVDIPEDDD